MREDVSKVKSVEVKAHITGRHDDAVKVGTHMKSVLAQKEGKSTIRSGRKTTTLYPAISRII